MNKNIIVTGGLGFIGSALIFRLLKETDTNIINIDKSKQRNDLISINYQLYPHSFLKKRNIRSGFIRF